MTKECSREGRARDPVRGLRQRLRIALRKAGIVGKFRTDLLRSGALMIYSKEELDLPFRDFEGHPVLFWRDLSHG